MTLPFGQPSALFANNSVRRASARFRPDERDIIFQQRMNDEPWDVFVAHRSSTAVLFPNGEPLLNVDSYDRGAFLTRDGLTLYFHGPETGVLMVSTRTSEMEDFGAPQSLAGLKYYGADPYLAGNDDVLYYSALDEFTGYTHIYRTELLGTGFSNNEVVVDGEKAWVERSSYVGQPVVSRDELTMYFSYTHSAGWGDIFLATRSSVDVPFTEIRRMDELNTEGSDYATWLSDDGCRIIVENDGYISLATKPR